MNFELNDDQAAIRQVARDLMASRFSDSELRDLSDQRKYADSVEAEADDLGWWGLTVPEDYGGAGLGMIELCLVIEELGYALAPMRFLSSAAAVLMLQWAGSREQQELWLPKMARGDVRGTVGWSRDGTLDPVPDADGADLLIEVNESGARILTSEQFTVVPIETIDLTRRYARVEVGTSGVPLPGDVEAGAARIQIALAAESVGVAQRTLNMAVEYAKTRRQFGHAIGEYQAISHRCVQMLLDVERARGTVLYAMWCADHAKEQLSHAAAVASKCAREAGWTVPASAMQVFGGIGFTWENLIHLFLRRGRANVTLFGSTARSRAVVANTVLD